VKQDLHQFALIERLFLAIPFEHSENIADQDFSVWLMAGIAVDAVESFPEYARWALDSFIVHRDLIRRFGRFPHRNAALGRSSTDAELAFLSEAPRGDASNPTAGSAGTSGRAGAGAAGVGAGAGGSSGTGADAGPDGKHKVVALVRKTISLEQQAAKASVHSIVDANVTRRVGVITLASFYEDFAARQKGAKDFKSATRDVARLLDGLKKEKVDSVLIDLRNNGGGSLAEAVELTGLFIDQGPVVQQRNASGQISIESDTQAGVAWDGPLGVLINRGSASASEIFAAAIQDYGRGLIIGEPSFGKGTVQTVVDLDRVAKNRKPEFGELKMTIAQFFRINGGTTQLRGVTPDIAFPSVSDPETFGESSFDNALPWTQIKAANYSPAGDLKGLLPTLLALHDARVKKDKDFQYLQEDIAESRLRRKKNLISLNEAERRKERAAEETRLMSRETRKDASNDVVGVEYASEKGTALRDDGLQPNERKLANELAAEKARKDAKDILLDEAVNILGDEVAVMKTGGGLTAGIQRGPVLLLE
jgi:carboxyl-terminal processing protease